MAGNFVRMKAARLFAAEIKATTIQVPKTTSDQYESQLYLTPTGAKTARVMVVGTATEIEDIGTDNSFFRMRVSDPTGVHFVTAGQYQPEATKIIQELAGKVPAFVAVVGKISVYTGNENNTPLVSIRAEQVTVVDDIVRDIWLLETSKATLDRVSALKSSAELEREVSTAYPTSQNYKELVRTVLRSMKESVDTSAPPASTPSAPAAPAPAAPVPAEAPAPSVQAAPKAEPVKAPDSSQEGMRSEQMDDFVEQQVITRNKGKGVKIETLGNPCKGAGIKLLQLDESIKRLMN
jgi:RPA family protein